jgi:hypothetical protein
MQEQSQLRNVMALNEKAQRLWYRKITFGGRCFVTRGHLITYGTRLSAQALDMAGVREILEYWSVGRLVRAENLIADGS